MDLLGILQEFLHESKTGQLVIKFAGETHLCKVQIENGDAVYISMGKKNPDETIAYITGKQPVEASFIDGIRPIKKVSEPLNSRLYILAGAGNGDSGISIDEGADMIEARDIDDISDMDAF